MLNITALIKKNFFCRTLRFFAAVLLIISAAVSLSANMRAPYHREYKNSSSLAKAGGIVLISEYLHFYFDHYFTGDAGKVSEEKNFCRIDAVYNVYSESGLATEFEFISPSPELISIVINNSIVKCNVTELTRTPESLTRHWGTIFYDDLYSFKFNGELVKGENKISVTYKQPAGVKEIAYGYFTRSRWSTFAGYEFSPIKEWKRSDNFTADVVISVPYDWRVMDYIFDPDIELDVTGFDREYKQKYKPEASGYIRNENSITRKFRISGDLPDKLAASISEK